MGVDIASTKTKKVATSSSCSAAMRATEYARSRTLVRTVCLTALDAANEIGCCLQNAVKCVAEHLSGHVEQHGSTQEGCAGAEHAWHKVEVGGDWRGRSKQQIYPAHRYPWIEIQY